MPRLIISNTTPIITFLGIGKLDLFEKMYESIVVPYEVYLEIEAGKDKPFYTDLKKIDWIKIEKVKNKELVEHLTTFLDKGEAEAIVLVEELQADLLLLDEKTARNYAKLKGYTCSGSFGVLLKAKEKGFVAEIKPLLEIAQSNGIRLSKNLIEIILREANEF
ncbi:DUF3368 domain-containing protein [Bernardetia sp. ABR2-2B]|uniref:DUF3368 domain-containing protein n=1 Tax=Bernardetia sp. ABR2-2B TaxID=3127472 RepID=UPI0030CDE2E0